MWDITTTGVTAALDALSARGSARADNIANAETPGFRAQYVDFEAALSDAWQRGTPERAEAPTVASPTIVGPNGNSVDVETEMISSMKDGVVRGAMTEAFNFKTGNLRMAIRGTR